MILEDGAERCELAETERALQAGVEGRALAGLVRHVVAGAVGDEPARAKTPSTTGTW